MEFKTNNKFNSIYKKVAIVIEIIVLVALLIIILKKCSLFTVFNVVSSICFPTVCVIVPTYFYICSIKLQRRLTFVEKSITYPVIVIGFIILILSVYNLFF